ncbi:MAG: tetratricopeptide repeat protein [Planctomycetes bacterium]|nr:tetratricopeptide repeat protein [Planctomycetota bacterium]
MTATSLGNLEVKRGELPKAGDCYRQALAMERRILPRDDARQAPALQGLPRCQLAAGRLAEAEAAAREAFDLQTAKLEGSWPHFAAMALLDRVPLARGRLAEAEPLLVEACARLQPPPRSTNELRDALSALAEFRERQGRADDAAALRARQEALSATDRGWLVPAATARQPRPPWSIRHRRPRRCPATPAACSGGCASRAGTWPPRWPATSTARRRWSPASAPCPGTWPAPDRRG